MSVLDTARGSYLDAAVQGDRAGAAACTAGLLAQGLEPAAILTGVLAPAQEEIGRRWEEGRCTVGREHLVTGITEAIVGSITVGLEPPPTRGTMLLATAHGDLHGLPARLAGELLRLQGWQVILLGPPSPASELQRAIEDLDPDVVGISCTMSTALTGAARSIRAARATGVPVLAGGSAFGTSSRRARRLGASGWVAALDHALDLTRDCWAEPLDPPGGDWEALDRERPALVEDALDTLSVAHPQLARPRHGLTTAVGDLDGLVRAAASALACGDPSVVHDHVAWLVRLHRTDGLPLATTRLELAVVAHVLRLGFPAASDLVGDARVDLTG